MSKRPFVIFGIFAAFCLVALPLWALAKEGGENGFTNLLVGNGNNRK